MRLDPDGDFARRHLLDAVLVDAPDVVAGAEHDMRQAVASLVRRDMDEMRVRTRGRLSG